jgi:hypothetical protein
MLTAASIYFLLWPNPGIRFGDVFDRYPISKNAARVVGWAGVAVSAGLLTLTLL